MPSKLNGFKPTLGTVITIVVLVASVAVSWGVNANRLDGHDRRLDLVEGLVRDMGKEVTETRVDVGWLREREEGK